MCFMRRACERGTISRPWVSSVDRPVNIVMGFQGVQLGLAELSQIGAKRISVGSSLCRAALAAFAGAAREMHEQGTFTYASQAASPKEMTAIFDSFKRDAAH